MRKACKSEAERKYHIQKLLLHTTLNLLRFASSLPINKLIRFNCLAARKVELLRHFCRLAINETNRYESQENIDAKVYFIYDKQMPA